MEVNCPKGHVWISISPKQASIRRTVRICGNICDSYDLCENTDCEFYDSSHTADKIYAKNIALLHSNTPKGTAVLEKCKKDFYKKYSQVNDLVDDVIIFDSRHILWPPGSEDDLLAQKQLRSFVRRL